MCQNVGECMSGRLTVTELWDGAVVTATWMVIVSRAIPEVCNTIVQNKRNNCITSTRYA